MTIQEQLTRTIVDHTAAAPAPLPDLAEAVRRGRVLRRRRRVTEIAATGLAGALVIAGVLAVTQRPDHDVSGSDELVPVGQLDYSSGLRAFASPDEDGRLWLGGRAFSKKDMSYLDTDATATPYGMVFPDSSGRARLLTQEGTYLSLAPAPPRSDADVRLSAKADARLPLVAFTQASKDGVSVVLHDLRRRRTVDTLDVPCSGASCEGVRVDGLDRGLVFVRTAKGTFTWDHSATGSRRWTALGEGKFRLADARNGRILWSGAPPAPPPESPVAHWQLTHGEIDAELSHDGRYVLYWSSILRPTTPGGRVIHLDVKHAAWFTFDTDGSVLAATTGSDQHSTVYDCVLPSGACARIGSVSTRSGDPMFIGNDM